MTDNWSKSQININTKTATAVTSFLFMPLKERREANSNCTVRPSLSRFVSGAYLLYSLKYESQIRCVDASWDGGVSRTIFGSR